MKWRGISQVEMAASGGSGGEHAPQQDLGSLADHGEVQFCDEIGRAGSVPRNATPCAVMQVPALGSRATSHVCVLQRLSEAQMSDRQKGNFLKKMAILRSSLFVL